MLCKIAAIVNTRISGMAFHPEQYLDIARQYAHTPIKALAAISVQIAAEAQQAKTSATLGKFVMSMRQLRARGDFSATEILKIIFPREFSISDKFVLKEDLKDLRKLIHTCHPNPDLDGAVGSLMSYLAALQSPDMAHVRQSLEYMGTIAQPTLELIDTYVGIPGFAASIFRQVDSFDTFVKDKFTSIESGIYYATMADSLFMATKAMVEDNNVEFIPIVTSSTDFHYEAGIRRDELLRYLYSLNARGDSDISEQLDVYKKLYGSTAALLETVSSLQKVLADSPSLAAATYLLEAQERLLDEMQAQINIHAQKLVSSSHSTVRDFMLWKEANEPRGGKHYFTTLRTSLNNQDFLNTIEKLSSLPILDKNGQLAGVITKADLDKNSVRIACVDTQEVPAGAEPRQVCVIRDHHLDKHGKTQAHMAESSFAAVGAAVSIVMRDLGKVFKTHDELQKLYLLTSIEDSDDYDIAKVRSLDQDEFLKAVQRFLPEYAAYDDFEDIPRELINAILDKYITVKTRVQQEYVTRVIKAREYDKLLLDGKTQEGFFVVHLKLDDANYKLFKQSDFQQWLTNEYTPQHPELERSLVFVCPPDKSIQGKKHNNHSHTQRYDEVYLYAKNAKEMPTLANYFINNIRQIDQQPFPEDSRAEYRLNIQRTPLSQDMDMLIKKAFPGYYKELIAYADHVPYLRQELKEDYFTELQELFAAGQNGGPSISIPFNPNVRLLRYPVFSVRSRKKQITPILADYKT